MFWNFCSIVDLALVDFVLKYQSNKEAYICQPRANSPANCNSYYSDKRGLGTYIEIEIPISQNSSI